MALKEDAKVISADGEEIGTIERILMNPDTDKATHFVVSRGMLTKTKKLIPSLWLDWADEDAVHLLVQKRLLDNLPEFDD